MKQTINPYGTKFQEEHEKEECMTCGVVCTPEHVLFKNGLPDAFIFCSDNCMFQYCQVVWAKAEIQYCNSKAKGLNKSKERLNGG